MSDRRGIRPSKPASIAAILVLLLLLGGTVALYLQGPVDLGPSFRPETSARLWSMEVLVLEGLALVLLVGIGYNAYNLAGGRYAALWSVETAGSDGDGALRDPAEALRELQSLEREGVVPEQEAETKRVEILKRM